MKCTTDDFSWACEVTGNHTPRWALTCFFNFPLSCVHSYNMHCQWWPQSWYTFFVAMGHVEWESTKLFLILTAWLTWMFMWAHWEIAAWQENMPWSSILELVYLYEQEMTSCKKQCCRKHMWRSGKWQFKSAKKQHFSNTRPPYQSEVVVCTIVSLCLWNSFKPFFSIWPPSTCNIFPLVIQTLTGDYLVSVTNSYGTSGPAGLAAQAIDSQRQHRSQQWIWWHIS